MIDLYLMIVEKIPAIGDLSAEDKYILANELWAQIETNESSLPFDETVVELLEKRHQTYLADPSKVTSWDTIKSKLGKS
ncbi:MAG: addiction module protein [Verrucomicrobiales bacterium]|nr:addiction module protein [Verrucomicrobiales bacterium]